MNDRNRKILDEIYDACKKFPDDLIEEIFLLLNAYSIEKSKELEKSISKLREELEEDLPKGGES